MQLSKLLEEFAASTAVPGGGSASAVAAALAASLGMMVCRLTLGRDKYEQVQQEVENLLGELEDHGTKLLGLADEDAAAYTEMAKAMSLPRETDQEKADRMEALQETAMKAAEVPARTLSASLRVMEIVARLCEIGNRNAISDAGCAMSLANAAVWGGYLNVLVNVPYLGDDDRREKLVESTKEDLLKATEIFKRAIGGISINL